MGNVWFCKQVLLHIKCKVVIFQRHVLGNRCAELCNKVNNFDHCVVIIIIEFGEETTNYAKM